VKEWASNFTVTIDGTTNAQTLVFTSPSGAIQVSDDIESDNYVAGSAGWKIERDTGNAEFQNATIRGTLNASDISTGTISVDRLPGLSTIAYDLSAGVAYIEQATATVTATFSSIPAGSTILINAAVGINGPGGSDDNSSGQISATSTGSFSVNAWNLSAFSYHVTGGTNDPLDWYYHSGVATKSTTGSCSFTFQIYCNANRRTYIDDMKITAVAIEA
jgi:hypothetical protein